MIAQPIGQNFLIATSHFESRDAHEIRCLQMSEAFNVLRDFKVDNAILVGDFNFGSHDKTQEGKILLQNNMTDIVSDFFEKESFTMYRTKKHAAWRPDKVLFRVG
jgi:hypothetical protein